MSLVWAPFMRPVGGLFRRTPDEFSDRAGPGRGYRDSPQAGNAQGRAYPGDGWLGRNPNPRFMKNRPNANTTGVSIVELRPNGNFNVFLALTSGGQFSYGGKTYGKAE